MEIQIYEHVASIRGLMYYQSGSSELSGKTDLKKTVENP